MDHRIEFQDIGMSKSKSTPSASEDREFFLEKPSMPVRRSRSERYATIYSNNIQVGMSFFDLRIQFNDVIAASKESISIEELATIVLAPEQARDLLAALQKSLQQYEERFGPLRPAPSGPPKDASSDA
jgi:hypothetical protein